MSLARHLTRISMLHLPAMAVLLGITGQASSASSCPANTETNQLAVQVVNDSGLSDDAVYLLLSGSGIGWTTAGAPTGLEYFDIATTPDGSATAGALNALDSCGTIVSPYTGKTLNVYNFSLAAITSGRMMVSYSPKLSISDGNFPTGAEKFRWDKMEFGYPASGADLTSLDFFSVPMQFDYLDSDGNIIDTMTFYSSTKTILDALYNLDASSMGKAFMPATWTPSQGVSTFTRVMGPSLQASNSKSGSPAPYPSFKAYLDSIAGETFTVSGAGNAGCSSSVTYDYSGTFKSDENNGYQVILTSSSQHPMGGTPCGVPPAAIKAQGTVDFDTTTKKVTGVTITQPGSDYFTAAPTVTFSGGGATTQATGVAVLSSSGAVKSVTINDGGEGYTSAPTVTFTAPPAPPATVALPSDLTVTVSLPKPGQNSGYDVDIYGAPATAFSVPETGMTAQQVASLANSLYSVIAGDFLAGVNFGYVGNGSNAPQNSADWYSNPPTLYPFGDARKTNDGYYNPYAAVFYNMSDAYGFAFSDRGGRPSPYVPLPANATTMRVTILNDERLDTPLTSVAKTADKSLTIKWPAVAGATGYAVDVSYGEGIPVEGITLSPSTPSASGTKISGLVAGTTYEIRVTATGSNSKGTAIKSHTQSIFATTHDSMAAPSGDIHFGTSLNWSVGTSKKPPARYSFSINGAPYTVGKGPNAAVQSKQGVNLYSLTITDTVTRKGKSTSSTVYQGNYVVEISDWALSTLPSPVSFGSAGGTIATGTATVANGSVESVAINKGGSNYSPSAAVTFSAPTSGTAAKGTAFVDTNGTVVGVYLSDAGSGYTSAPTVTFPTPKSGTQATGTATIGENGEVASVTITGAGSGYAIPPAVVFATSPGGEQAEGTATVDANGSVSAVLVTNGGKYYMFTVQNAFLTPANANPLNASWSSGSSGFPAGPIPNDGSLVIGTPFSPEPGKKISKVCFPSGPC